MVWLASINLQMRKGLTLIPAMIIGVFVFATAQYVTTASPTKTDLVWYKSEEQGYAVAKKENKPIIIDGWAEWCEACKKMEATTFREPKLVQELSQHWVLIKLDLTEDSDANDEIIDRYGMPGLPTMVLLPPNGNLDDRHKIVGEKSAAFFLKELQKYRASL